MKDATDEPVSRRDRPAKAPLRREVIVETALRILDREGIDALSMRKVAQALDTGAASLYVYVRNRDHLLQLMLDRALDAVPLPSADQGSWQQRLIALTGASVAALTRYPGLAFVSLASIPAGENALRIAEYVMSLLREGGVDDRVIAWAVDLIALYVSATAVEQGIYDTRGRASESGYLEEVARIYDALPPERFPTIVAMRHQLLAGTGDERFAWGMQVLINGIVNTAPSDDTA